MSIRKLSSNRKAALVKRTGPSLAVASWMRAFVERNFIVKHVCQDRCTDCFAKREVANLSSIWRTHICENFGINVRDASGEVTAKAGFAKQTVVASYRFGYRSMTGSLSEAARGNLAQEAAETKRALCTLPRA